MAVQGSKSWRYIEKEENMQREDIKMLVNRWWEIPITCKLMCCKNDRLLNLC
jgi:hypothetical protein